MTDQQSIIATTIVQTAKGALGLSFEAGRPIVVLGKNGAGKSALVHHLAGRMPNHAVYIPGSRPSYFSNESLSLTAASRRDLANSLRSWDSSPDTRWRSLEGTSRNEKAIHDLQAAEVQSAVTATEDIKREGVNSPAIGKLISSISPVDRVNALLHQAGLAVQVLMKSGELQCQRNGSVYSIAKMSDGERTALIIAAEVVAAAPGSIFIIDEPELHIHRAIVVSLFTAVVAERADCAFVISTHELELANSLEGVRVLLVRESEWHGGAVQHWDIDFLPTVADVPESLRVDLLGARRKILFVEGTPSSLDQPFYSLLFPNVSVCTKETCRDVRRSVVGLQGTFDLHHVAAFGIVDGDGMPDSMVATLRGEGVFALPVYSVEGLYYSAEVRRVIAELQSKTFGVAAVDLIAEANAAALESLKAGQIRHLAVRKSERIIREQLIAAMPERDEIAGGKSASLSLSISSPFEAERTRLEGMVANADLDSIVASYPIRESGVLTAIAAGLRFRRREDYERAALTCIVTTHPLRRCDSGVAG